MATLSTPERPEFMRAELTRLPSAPPAGVHPEKILLVLVGLPARGKSYVAAKVTAFLRWRGISCASFNVGAQRRKAIAVQQDAHFFASDNAAAKALREAVAMDVLHTALLWLHDVGSVAILDATNTTRSRRARVLATVSSFTPPAAAVGYVPPSVIFVECICNDGSILERNMLQKVSNSPDYAHMRLEEALEDLKARVAEYEKVYEQVDEGEEDPAAGAPLSYIKLIDLNSKIVCRHISGSTAFLITSFLMVTHIESRPIFLVRAGMCNDDAVRAAIARNRNGSVGVHPVEAAVVEDGRGRGPTAAVNAGLTLNEAGKRFAASVADFIVGRTGGRPYSTEDIVMSAPRVASSGHYPSREGPEGKALPVFTSPPAVYTSTLPRTMEMAAMMPYSGQQHTALNPMETGICMGIPLQYLEAQFPDEWARFSAAPDKARHRITGGESLDDVVQRLTPFVIEMERQRRPVVIISHLSTLQVLLAYFKGVPIEECIHLSFPMNTIVEFRSHQYGWIEQQFTFTSAVKEAAAAPATGHLVW